MSRELAAEGAVAASSLRRPPQSSSSADLLADAARGRTDRRHGRGAADDRQPGDVIIDGGNSFFKDDVRRAGECRERGIHYVDVGTSGGVWGLERGYCLMIGGEKPVVEMLDPIFDTLAPGLRNARAHAGREAADDRAERGYIHAGPAGAGHFVKMVHNGIEYGLMQAYAEGFDVLKGARPKSCPRTSGSTSTCPTSPRCGGADR